MSGDEVRWLFVASMDVDPEHEALFNEVYDTEHVPNLSRVPGVLSVRRLVREDAEIAIGGARRPIEAAGEPKYSAVYALASPDVLTSEAWAEAIERGRWPGEVRPHTHNRHHVLYRVVSPP